VARHVNDSGRTRRLIGHIVTIIATVTSAGVVWLWIRSFVVHERVHRASPTGTWYVESVDGGLIVSAFDRPRLGLDHIEYRRRGVELRGWSQLAPEGGPGLTVRGSPFSLPRRVLGFQVWFNHLDSFVMRVPYFALLAPVSSPVLFAAFKAWRRRRRRRLAGFPILSAFDETKTSATVAGFAKDNGRED